MSSSIFLVVGGGGGGGVVGVVAQQPYIIGSCFFVFFVFFRFLGAGSLTGPESDQKIMKTGDSRKLTSR